MPIGGARASFEDSVHALLALLHHPADLRRGHCGGHHHCRADRLSRPAGVAISRHRAADRHGQRGLSRCLGRDGRGNRRRADRAGNQRRRQHAVPVVAIDRRRQIDDHRHLQDRHQSRCSAGAGAEPRRGCGAASARGCAAPGRRHAQDQPRLPDGGEPGFARRLARSRLYLQLRADAGARSSQPHRRRRRRAIVRRARLFDAHLDRSRPRRRARSDRRRNRRRVARAERPGRRRHARPTALRTRECLPAQRRDARPPDRSQAIRRCGDPHRQGRPPGQGIGRRPRRTRRAGLWGQHLYQRQADRHRRGVPASRLQRARRRAGRVGRDGGDVEEIPQGPRLPRYLQPHRVHRPVDRRGEAHADRGDDPRRPRHPRLPAEMARSDHPDRGDPGIADRHLRGAGGGRLLAQQPLAVRAGAGDRHRGR
ncbi:hypothetical protein D9M73_120590 [compost metagenome]